MFSVSAVQLTGCLLFAYPSWRTWHRRRWCSWAAGDLAYDNSILFNFLNIGNQNYLNFPEYHSFPFISWKSLIRVNQYARCGGNISGGQQTPEIRLCICKRSTFLFNDSKNVTSFHRRGVLEEDEYFPPAQLSSRALIWLAYLHEGTTVRE